MQNAPLCRQSFLSVILIPRAKPSSTPTGGPQTVNNPPAVFHFKKGFLEDPDSPFFSFYKDASLLSLYQDRNNTKSSQDIVKSTSRCRRSASLSLGLPLSRSLSSALVSRPLFMFSCIRSSIRIFSNFLFRFPNPCFGDCLDVKCTYLYLFNYV